jgi:hypothetical protein
VLDGRYLAEQMGLPVSEIDPGPYLALRRSR